MKLSACLLLVSAVLAGCGGSSASTDNADKNDPDQNPKVPPVAEVKVPIEIKSWDEVQALVAKQKGKIVIIDMWSTT